MSITSDKIFVTGANGQLGKLVIEFLLKKLQVPKSQIVAGVRTLAKGSEWAAQGIEVREAPYDSAEALAAAFKGVQRILLISSNELGKDRAAQHRSVIEAAKKLGAGLKLLAYTSLVNASSSTLGVARDHVVTEGDLKASGLPTVVLRNGWYAENNFGSLPSILEHGQHFGSAGASGRISYASVRDYAEATAVVLADKEAGSHHVGQVYELGGDEAYTNEQWVSVLSSVAGKEIKYVNLPKAEYKALLLSFGLPDVVAELVSDSDAEAAKGGLYTDSKALSKLIGHPTLKLKDLLAEAVNKTKK